MKFNIRLDVCTLCRLNCPTCSMRLLNYGDLGAGYLKFEKYKEFINNNDNLIKRIEISNAGEPFLNPDIIDILKYSYEKNIDITCNNATTLNFNNNKVLEAIVDYQVKTLVVAIDGVTQDIYERYRRNGDLNLVLTNLKYLLDYKQKVKSPYPEIKWQYVIMEGTEDKYQIDTAKQMAKDFNINISFKLTWDNNYMPKNVGELKELTGLTFLTRKDYEIGVGCDYNIANKCSQLWSFPQLNWNGQLLGCCFNRKPFNINVFDLGKNGLIKLFKSNDLLSAKRWLMNNSKENDIETPCHLCKNSIKVKTNKLITTDFISKWEKLYNIERLDNNEQ